MGKYKESLLKLEDSYYEQIYTLLEEIDSLPKLSADDILRLEREYINSLPKSKSKLPNLSLDYIKAVNNIYFIPIWKI